MILTTNETKNEAVAYDTTFLRAALFRRTVTRFFGSRQPRVRIWGDVRVEAPKLI